MSDLRQKATNENMRYKRLDWTHLRNFKATQAKLAVAYSQQNMAFDVQAKDRPYTVQIERKHTLPTQMLFVVAWFDEEPLAAYIDLRILEHIIASRGYTQKLIALSPDALARVIDFLLFPLLSDLNALPAENFIIEESVIVETPKLTDCVVLNIQDEDRELGALILVGSDDILDATAACIHRNWPPNLQKKTKTPLQIAASFQVPAFITDLGEISNLNAGDGFLLEEGWDPNNVRRLITADHLFEVAVKNEGLVEIRSRPKPIAHKLKGLRSKMVENSEMPIELSIEIAREKFSIDTLQTLSEGALLEFPIPVGSTATLMHNSERVADCEILEINGNYGIRVIAVE